jgi:hypothetical protein
MGSWYNYAILLGARRDFMNEKQLLEQWEPHAFLMPFDQLTEKLKFPREFLLDEEIDFIIPCTHLVSDGPALKEVVIVTQSYLGYIAAGPGDNIDFVSLEPLRAVTVRLGRHEVNLQPPQAAQAGVPLSPVTVTYETAMLNFHYGALARSDLSYVGSANPTARRGFSRKEWLELVRRALPLSLMRRRQHLGK